MILIWFFLDFPSHFVVVLVVFVIALIRLGYSGYRCKSSVTIYFRKKSIKIFLQQVGPFIRLGYSVLGAVLFKPIRILIYSYQFFFTKIASIV